MNQGQSNVSHMRTINSYTGRLLGGLFPLTILIEKSNLTFVSFLPTLNRTLTRPALPKVPLPSKPPPPMVRAEPKVSAAELFLGGGSDERKPDLLNPTGLSFGFFFNCSACTKKSDIKRDTQF